MNIAERYKLFLKWCGITYNGNIATFDRVWFEGPVLKIAAKIEPDTYIDMDFSKQNITSGLFLPDTYYIARLYWKDVEYKDNRVFLIGCTLTHPEAGTLKNLEDGFYAEIDCSDHEAYRHRKTLVYPAVVKTKEDRLIK